MAVALFPLLDGETIGSNLGRYGEFIGLETTLPLRRRLFGYGCRPDTRLPSGLRHLAEQARDYWKVDMEAIINNHTEFSYATLTIDAAQREVMRSNMLDQPSGRCLRRSVCGWTGERITKFRYCEACLSEWRANGVPAHWQVDQQLPGVYFCNRHACVLKMTNPLVLESFTDPTLTAVKRDDDKLVLEEMSTAERNAIEDVAKRSAECRAARESLPSAKTYREFLRDARIVWPNGRIDERAFIAAVLGYLGNEYCQIAGVSWQKMTSWLRNIAKEEENNEHSHPLMFIAAESLLRYRCESPGYYLPADKVFAVGRSFELRESSNSIDDEILKEFACRGILHRKNDNWKAFSGEGPAWLVTCSCGVSYQALKASSDGRAQLTVRAYGDRYHRLILAGKSGGVVTEASSREVNLNHTKFTRWARCAGFYKERNSATKEIPRLRVRWQSLIEHAQPGKRITSAYQLDPPLYRTLRRYDREWFVAFNLENRKRLKCSSFVSSENKRNNG
ncbi:MULTISPECIES: TnsD family Tn7-like transposition protein [unclassified Paraburkholderia]|uniref:TnsD family Tn7-like transposition protein n=1 Tax=unclassified Paraburkholderia TaxID=2615204 RepID=UPI002AB0B7EF|nr:MULTISPECIES: TnsD family Tn7-like transposition protein [unclassified Paraburkholderia]